LVGQRRLEAPYQVAIEPAGSRVRAQIDGHVVADSDDVLVMHETYLPSQCYFPKAGLIDNLLVASPFRTFCPFKGTAHHWHLQLSDRTIENAAWSYDAPLPDASRVGGYIAFYPRVVEELLSESPLPTMEIEQSGDSPLIDWLMHQAWLCKTPAELTQQFAQRLLMIGMPLWRLSINLWTLHPELAGQRLIWTRDSDGVVESDTPFGVLQQPPYLNSPVRHVSDGLGGVRQRLDVDNPEFQFPIMDELRTSGGTDYIAMPLPFSDGRFHSLTLATDHPEGFSTANLGQTFEAVLAMGRFFEVLTLRRNATVLFDTYLGSRTGQQVLNGLTHRGDGEDIRAVILYCDLRDSTTLLQSLSRETYLDLLNTFFEHATGPILAAGGEVLKYIGDAVLAIFPLEGDATDDETISAICWRAREVAQEIVSRIVMMPIVPEHAALQCAIGLHFGDLMYGNIGVPQRLDFTVIGTAVNVAARLSEECKILEQPILLSADVARYAPQNLNSLGTRHLHNLKEDIEVFVVAGAEFG
jgi:adenylate cyclase